MNVQKKMALALVRTRLQALSMISKKKAGEEAFRLFITPPTRSKKKSERFGESENITLWLNGQRIQGYRVNHPAPKKALLLHGFSSSSQHFEKYVDPLVEAGYEVLAFDAPAHGKSEGKTIHALMYSEMIRTIIQEFGPIDSFIGHSFGGLSVCLALENTIPQPDTRIVLIAPATETTTAIQSAFRLIGLKNDAVREEMENIIFSMSGRKAEWFSVRRAIHNLEASVLWVHDTDDDITPLSDTHPVQDAGHKHVRFHITRGLGHHQVYRHPDVIREVVSFLR